MDVSSAERVRACVRELWGLAPDVRPELGLVVYRASDRLRALLLRVPLRTDISRHVQKEISTNIRIP